jgi:hypothetical protein
MSQALVEDLTAERDAALREAARAREEGERVGAELRRVGALVTRGGDVRGALERERDLRMVAEETIRDVGGGGGRGGCGCGS